MRDKLISLTFHTGFFVVGGIVTVISWFRKTRPDVLEDPEWVMKATERELTVARLTGNYTPHPHARRYPCLNDAQLAQLASKMIEVAKRDQATKK